MALDRHGARRGAKLAFERSGEPPAKTWIPGRDLDRSAQLPFDTAEGGGEHGVQLAVEAVVFKYGRVAILGLPEGGERGEPGPKLAEIRVGAVLGILPVKVHHLTMTNRQAAEKTAEDANRIQDCFKAASLVPVPQARDEKRQHPRQDGVAKIDRGAGQSGRGWGSGVGHRRLARMIGSGGRGIGKPTPRPLSSVGHLCRNRPTS